MSSLQINIARVPIGGGPQESFGDNNGDRAGGIFVDDDRVYWVYTFDTKPGVVLSKEKTAGATVGYPNTARNPLAILADDKMVYWISLGTSETASLRNDGKLQACPKAGCPASGPTVLVGSLENGNALAQDAVGIYFTEAGLSGSGRVRKIAKP